MKRTLLVTLLLLSSAGQANATAIAYMSGQYEPWSLWENIDAMDAAFGEPNWDRIEFGAAFSDYDTLYVDGGADNSDNFFTWVDTNRSALETYVMGGGELFLNAAGWSAAGPRSMLFGSTLTEQKYSSYGQAVTPGHAMFTDAGTSWDGTDFSHDAVTGLGLTAFITGEEGAILAGAKFGSGYYMLGGQTSSFFHSGGDPFQLRVNELQFVAGQGGSVPEPASLALFGLGLAGLGFARRRKV